MSDSLDVLQLIAELLFFLFGDFLVLGDLAFLGDLGTLGIGSENLVFVGNFVLALPIVTFILGPF